MGPRGSGGCFLRGGENWSCVWCGAVRGGGRRRRIKATCGAHVETQTRVCLASVFESPGKRGTSPKGTAARVPGDATINSRGARNGGKDAEKGKSPGTAAGGKEEAAAHNPRRGHTRKRPRARGGGGGLAGPGAHCVHPAAHTRAKPLTHPAHPADTPAPHPARHTQPTHPRHTPLTHPANTPPTHPAHTHPAAPQTHPDRRRCGTGLRGCCRP